MEDTDSVESIRLNGSTKRVFIPNGSSKHDSTGILPGLTQFVEMGKVGQEDQNCSGVLSTDLVEADMTLGGPNQLLPAESFWTSSPNGTVKLRMGKSGREAAAPVSVPTILMRTVKKYPDVIALRQRKDDRQVFKLIIFCFIKLGLPERGGVCILGFNSPEWFIADYGTIFAGGLVAGLYTTNSSDACLHCALNCSASIFVVENEKQLEKVLKIRPHLSELKAIVQYTGEVSSPGVLSWKQLLEIGIDEDDTALEERLKKISVNSGCTIIYTSGTTGPPKGALLSHDNITFTAGCAIEVANLTMLSEQVVSYLPLSHIAAQLFDLHLPASIAATVTFADPDALKGSLTKTLKEVRPTLFLGVPRVYEKMQEKMLEVGGQVTGWKRSLANWAKATAVNYHSHRMSHDGQAPWSPSFLLARSLVLKKVKGALGLDRMKIMISGAAPISKEVLEYFLSLDLPIQQVYGMSECTGPNNFERFEAMTVGSVGEVIPGVLSKINDPDEKGNGEIIIKGRSVFMGYLQQPEKTKEIIDDDGWLHSGDIGCVDERKRFFITGRIKELIITAGGENIPPVVIEEQVLKELPVLSNAMLIGDRRKFLTMLVTLKVVVDVDSGESCDELLPVALDWCRKVGSSAKRASEILNGPDQKVLAGIQAGIDRYNRNSVSQAQRIGKWKLLPKDFTQLGGELGPTMKLIRPSVVEKYAKEIDEMYAV
ncbi:unnamed protein product [Notodromas monacha]|uniref:long-chain-fatty-acid--CoA ligase n=1 Tax=Notodromas monacha TaxID=399045 RepID=A0A7R9BIR1_9CRUS|nr:unnamed protein product [Notodromas monacha]CAG0915153.1 unnamed protein product [Notodromas monacha]